MANWLKLAVSLSVAAQKMAKANTQKAKLAASRKFRRFMFRPTMGAATKAQQTHRRDRQPRPGGGIAHRGLQPQRKNHVDARTRRNTRRR